MLLILALLHFSCAWASYFDLFPHGSNDPAYVGNNQFTLSDARPYAVDLTAENWSTSFVEIMVTQPGHLQLGCHYSLSTGGSLVMEGRVSVRFDRLNKGGGDTRFRNTFKIVLRPGMLRSADNWLYIKSTCSFSRYAHVFAPQAADGQSFVYDLRRNSVFDQQIDTNVLGPVDTSAAEVSAVGNAEGSYIKYGSVKEFTEDYDNEYTTDNTIATSEEFWRGEIILDLTDQLTTMTVPVLEINFYKAQTSDSTITVRTCSAFLPCNAVGQFTTALSSYSSLSAPESYFTGFDTVFVGLDVLKVVNTDGNLIRSQSIRIQCSLGAYCFPYIRLWDASSSANSSPSLLDLRTTDNAFVDYTSTLAVTQHPDCSPFANNEHYVTGTYVSCEWRATTPFSCSWNDGAGITFTRPAGSAFLEANLPSAWKEIPYPVIQFYSFDANPENPLSCTGDPITGNVEPYIGKDSTTAFSLYMNDADGGTTMFFTTPESDRGWTGSAFPSLRSYQVDVYNADDAMQTASRFRFEAMAAPDASSINMHAFATIFSAPTSCYIDRCNSRGTCVPGFSGKWSCDCMEGYHGASCEIDVCETRPCVHGDCSPGAGGTIAEPLPYLCYCTQSADAPTWAGPNCDIPLEVYITNTVSAEVNKVLEAEFHRTTGVDQPRGTIGLELMKDPQFLAVVQQETALHTDDLIQSGFVEAEVQDELDVLLATNPSPLYPTQVELDQAIAAAIVPYSSLVDSSALIFSILEDSGYITDSEARGMVEESLNDVNALYIPKNEYHAKLDVLSVSYLTEARLEDIVNDLATTYVTSGIVDEHISASIADLEIEFRRRLDESVSAEEIENRIHDSLVAARLGVTDLEKDFQDLTQDVVTTCNEACPESDSTCVRYDGLDHCVFIDVLSYSTGSTLFTVWSFFLIAFILAFV